ncbi:MAG: protein kinase [Planctomycetota bacterium]
MDLSTRMLGDYRLLEEIGRGGMGVVYEAIQLSLDRRVALKVLPGHFSLEGDALDRFEREAMLASRLRHRAIATVYGIGSADDLRYFAMELIDGPSLEACLKVLRGRRPSELTKSLPEEAGHPAPRWVPGSPWCPFYAATAAWLAEICDALEEAHGVNVLHRDVKPSNILLRRDGSPVLVDFGLSRDRLEGGLTLTGDAVGTPAYMAPEQARGEKRLDGRVDVYGVGATLYELVGFCPPFVGENPPEVMHKVVYEEPGDPRALNPLIPVDLVSIILRCLEKDPGRRYPSAAELGRELRLFLRGELVPTRTPGRVDRLRRWVLGRRRVIAASLISALLVATSLMGLGWIRERTQRADARGELVQALTHLRAGRLEEALPHFEAAVTVLGRDEVKEAWVGVLEDLAGARYAEGQHAQARELFLTGARRYLNDPDVKSWMRRAEGRGRLRVTQEPPGAEISIAALGDSGWPEELSPFVGQTLSIRERHLVRVSAPGHVDALRVVEVPRDGTLTTRMQALPAAELRPGTVYVAGNGRGLPPYLIDRTEVTCAQYSSFLKELPAELRADLRPKDPEWNGDAAPKGREEYPVRHVPVHAALAYARAKGGHLPTIDEFVTAGNLGGTFAYPWGSDFDAALVMHAPFGSRPLEPAGSRPNGASISGCQDLVGSVAEWVVGPDGQVAAQGGGFLSKRDELGLFHRSELDPLRAYPGVGFRLAYYLEESPEAPAPSEIQARSERMGTEVRLTGDGAFSVDVELAGEWQRSETGGFRELLTFMLPGGVSSFHMTGSMESRGLLLAEPAEPPIDRVDMRPVGLRAAAKIERTDGRFRAEILRRGWPKQALIPLPGGTFLHRFPIVHKQGRAESHVLRIPARSRVLRSVPAAREERVRAGERILSFRGAASESGLDEAREVEVEFALDLRAPPLPSRSEIEQWIAAFCRHWNASSSEELAEIVDPAAFTFGSAATPWAELHSVLRRKDRFRIELEALRAISGIGPLVRVEAELVREYPLLRNRVRTPMAFTFVEQDGRHRLIDLSSRLGRDRGQLGDDAEYRNKDLGVRIPAHPEFVPLRMSLYPTRMQLALVYDRPLPLELVRERKVFQPDTEILILGDELPEDGLEDEERRVVEMQFLADSLLPYKRLPMSRDAAEDRGPYEAGHSRGEYERMILYLADEGSQRKRYVFQKRIYLRRGRMRFLIVASVRSRRPEVAKSAYAVERPLKRGGTATFEHLIDEVLSSMRFEPRSRGQR